MAISGEAATLYQQLRNDPVKFAKDYWPFLLGIVLVLWWVKSKKA